MTKLKILKPGLLTTVQDRGRFLGLSLGLAQSGVMDNFAYDIALLLIESEGEQPVIEVTGGQFCMVVDCECEISITGADSEVYINEVKIQLWQSYQLRKDDKIEIKNVSFGLRNYIAVKGTWHTVDFYKSSCSTDLKAKLGGYLGRQLKLNDEIFVDEQVSNIKKIAKIGLESKSSSKQSYFSQIRLKDKLIRVCDGPQINAFTSEVIEQFFSNVYEVSPFSDRMGIRLVGNKISHKVNADIITDVVAFGAIQIPGDGMPIVMMADRQATGGYTKIANVIFEDLSILAQANPGDQIRFLRTGVETSKANKIEIDKYNLVDVRQYKMTLEEDNPSSNAIKNFNVLVETIT